PCIFPRVRTPLRLPSRRFWDELQRDLKPIYTAVNASAARAVFDELADKWGQRYPAVIRLWDNAWAEFIPFLDYGACRRMRVASVAAGLVICSVGRRAGGGHGRGVGGWAVVPWEV